jgi:hypothetical protein
LIVVAVALAASLLPTVTQADELGDLSEGFAHIQAALGPDIVGTPVTVELPADDSGTYVVTQRDDGTPGLLTWDSETNMTTFTDGVTTWSLADLLAWSQQTVPRAAPHTNYASAPASGLPPLRVAICESHNSNGAVGIFGERSRWQILPSTYAGTPPGQRGVPILQGADEAAAYLYATRGLQPWASSRGCWGR